MCEKMNGVAPQSRLSQTGGTASRTRAGGVRLKKTPPNLRRAPHGCQRGYTRVDCNRQNGKVTSRELDTSTNIVHRPSRALPDVANLLPNPTSPTDECSCERCFVVCGCEVDSILPPTKVWSPTVRVKGRLTYNRQGRTHGDRCPGTCLPSSPSSSATQAAPANSDHQRLPFNGMNRASQTERTCSLFLSRPCEPLRFDHAGRSVGRRSGDHDTIG